MATLEKQVMVVGIDDSEHSTYALEWTLDHFFTPSMGSNSLFKLVVVYAKPSASSTVENKILILTELQPSLIWIAIPEIHIHEIGSLL
ncbi:hypothetical protein OIU78_016321 [Salix suchowensis]|nr:hypothetical protein OIU78_016321 [Salix suchowensis]